MNIETIAQTGRGQAAYIKNLGYTDVSSHIYDKLRFWTLAAWNLLRPQNINMDKVLTEYVSRLSISEDIKQRWHKLFDVGNDEYDPPFIYASIAATLAMYRMFSKLGINMKNLLHYRNIVEYYENYGLMEAGRSYFMKMSIQNIIPRKSDRIIVVFQSDLSDQRNVINSRALDFMHVKRCNPKTVEKLKQQMGNDDGHVYQSPFFSSNDENHEFSGNNGSEQVKYIPYDAGVRYGKISGDMNLVHTSPSTARFFGFPKPFVQGYYLTNMIIKMLTQLSEGKLGALDISFMQPTFVDQHVKLTYNDSRFSVEDQNGGTLAKGRWAGAAGSRPE